MKNKVQLIGHVGQDPEIRTISESKKVANFSLATNDSFFNDKGEKVEQTEWHRLVAWGKTADVIEKFVVKGKEIAVEGKITYKTFEDKEGNKKNYTEILVNELLLLGK